ncbi:unnamed protein product [Urochloa decumbens]|uniref:Uncharacterized protein n=1 Tax=Urochloa decumbens TaxID=240449 RepID=A0ABC8YX43_9POAL
MSAPRSSPLLALVLAMLLLAASSPQFPLVEAAYGVPQAGGKYGGRRLLDYLREAPPPPIGPLPNIPVPPPPGEP